MSTILEIAKSYSGIIGALLGSTTTLITTHLIKNSGKISIDVTGIEIEYIKKDDRGFLRDVEVPDEDCFSTVKLSLDIYNSSDNTKVISDIFYELIDENKKVLGTGKLDDLSTGKQTSHLIRYEKFDHINCEPKKLVKKELKIEFEPSNILLVVYSKKIRLKFKKVGKYKIKRFITKTIKL